MKKIYILFVVLFFSITTIFLGGCKDKKDKITLGEVTHSVFYAPQYIALSEGIFESYGLKILR